MSRSRLVNIPLDLARSAVSGMEQGVAALFEYRTDGWPGRLQSSLLALMYVVGLLLWWLFLNGGDIRFDLHDWVEAGHRYAFLKDAATTGQLPLHMPGDWALRGVTLRFINVVDTNLSPQVLLLRFLDVGRFVLLNTLLLYSAGFVGLLTLRRRFHFSVATTSLLFLLLFFNGHVTGHIAVGHTHWAAYLLSPFIIMSVFSALEGSLDVRWTVWTSFLLFFIFLQGGYHLFMITLLFMTLLALAVPKNFSKIAIASGLAVLLSSIRILPALLDVDKFDTEFFTGFPSGLHVLEGLVVLRSPLGRSIYDPLPSNPLGWWEFDYYIGIVGSLCVLLFILLPGEHSRLRTQPLLVPMAGMTVISVGRIYKTFHLLHVPLLATQRVSSRFFFIPFILAIAIAAIKAQDFLANRQTRLWHHAAGLAIIGLVGNDIWQHLKSWRIVNMEALFEPAAVDLTRNVVVDRTDLVYEALVAAGALITVLTIAGGVWMLMKEARKENQPNE